MRTSTLDRIPSRRGAFSCRETVSCALAGAVRDAASRGFGRLSPAERYRRAVEPLVRLPMGVVLSVATFAVAASVGGRAGTAIAAAWIFVMGTYCAVNFLDCRETHCAITSGWTLLGLLGLVAAAVPGESISFYTRNVEVIAFVAILVLGFAVEWTVAARTGRRTLGRGGVDAQGC